MTESELKSVIDHHNRKQLGYKQLHIKHMCKFREAVVVLIESIECCAEFAVIVENGQVTADNLRPHEYWRGVSTGKFTHET